MYENIIIRNFHTIAILLLLIVPLSCRPTFDKNPLISNLNSSNKNFGRNLYKYIVHLSEGDTIFFPSGHYDMSAFPTTPIYNKIHWKGEKGTVFMGSQNDILFWNTMQIEDITFENFGTALYNKSNHQDIEVNISNCNFINCQTAIKLSSQNKARSNNINISNCKIEGNAHSEYGIVASMENRDSGIINILNNTISDVNLRGIQVGTNNIKNNPQFYNVNVAYNIVRRIGLTIKTDEINGIIVYGRNVTISNNKLTDIAVNGDDSEGIYTKVINGKIINNDLQDAGGNEGMINIKGNDIGSGKFPEGGNIEVSNNKINGTYRDKNISLLNVQCSNVTLANNKLIGGDYGITCRRYKQAGNNVKIIKNEFSHQSEYCIHFKLQNVEEVYILDNKANEIDAFLYLRGQNLQHFTVAKNVINEVNRKYAIKFEDISQSRFFEIKDNQLSNAKTLININKKNILKHDLKYIKLNNYSLN